MVCWINRIAQQPCCRSQARKRDEGCGVALKNKYYENPHKVALDKWTIKLAKTTDRIYGHDFWTTE